NCPVDVRRPPAPPSRPPLDVELSPDPRARVRDPLPLASPQRLRLGLAPPFRRGFIERAVDPLVEVAKSLEPGGHLALARPWIATRGVPEPRIVSGVPTADEHPQHQEDRTGGAHGARKPSPLIHAR